MCASVTDSTFIGPWLANTIRLCDGLVYSIDYWAFSDVFEEQGVNTTPFYGGFGLIAAGGIPKPSLNVFRALHKLGDTRLPLQSDSALATRSSDGPVVLALWNYAPPIGTGSTYTMPAGSIGPARSFDVHIAHMPDKANVQIFRVDPDHGNVLKAFDAMGRPAGSLTPSQIAALKTAGAMAPTESARLDRGTLHLTVPSQGLAVVVIAK